MSKDRELYEALFIGKWKQPTRVEFTDEEENMIRKLASKIGYSKEDAVKLALREAYTKIIVCDCGGVDVNGVR